MSTPILITKLFIPPTRSELVPRHSLIKKLNEGIDKNIGFGCKLTLISAPAGFGKTTLVSEWADFLRSDSSEESQTDNKIAWLSIDEDDNDPTRFLTYFIAALKRAAGIREDLAESLVGMLQSPQTPHVKDILTAIINEVAELAGRLIIFIDDYHLIESSLINDALALLIEYLPPQLHLVIITRDDPHLPLARFRAKGHMVELRAADLRFTPAEITEFLHQKLGIHLSYDEIARLDAHTEGWITGLHLVAVSLQGQENISRAIRDVSGSHRFVLDYLLEEVLNQQSEEIQEFLLQTAILNRLTGALCDSLTGQTNGQEILEYLEHANLFIVPLDQERYWYRYHHIFADLLRLRLHRIFLEREPALHLRASEWYKQNGYIDDAIDHALSSKDYDRTVQLIVEHVDDILKRGQYVKLWYWLDHVPEEFTHSEPDLCILNAWYLFARGELDKAESNLQTAVKHVRPDGNIETDLDHMEKAKLRGRIAGVRAFIASYRGDIPGIIQNAHHALDELPVQDLAWRSMIAVALGDAYGMAGDMNAAYNARVAAYETSKAGGNIYLVLLTSMKLAITYRMMGQLQRVIDICQEQLCLANEKGVSQMAAVGWLLAIWAEILAETNQLEEALSKGEEGAKITARGDDIAMTGWSHLCLARILHTQRDFAGAENIIRDFEAIAFEHQMPPFIANGISAFQTRILLARNKLDAVKQWVNARDLKIEGEITQLNESEYIVFARILLAEGRIDEAISLLHRLLESAEAVGRISRMIEILLLLALTSQDKDEIEKALGFLAQALAHGEPGGFVRTFVDEGPRLARLLYKAAARKIAPEYVGRLLSAFPVLDAEQTIEAKSQTPASELIEHLSKRELEVLRLVAKGHTRKEIATNLILSANTVKTHVRNIYSKLGVNNQMKAVGKARGLGLLEID